MNYFTHQADMPLDAPSYVPRAADEEIFEGISHGEFCYLLTPSQMGKSSLMIRTKARLEKEGCKVTAFSLESIGCASVENPTQLYLGMLDKIGAYLEMEDELSAFWDAQPHLSPLQRFIKALDYAARRNPKRNGGSSCGNLVVMIDEIGLVRKLGFPTGELFGAIREVHSHQSSDRASAPLTFCLLGTATPSELVDDPATTPFRLGRRIDLRDFTLSEAMQLTRGLTDLGMDRPTAEAVLRRVHYWTGGHPRLTQRLCGKLAETYLQVSRSPASPPLPIPHPEAWVDTVCEELLFAGNPIENDDSLACVHDRLLLRAGAQLADLLDLYRKIRAGRGVPDDKHDPLVSQLLLSGIVRSEKGRLVPRNRIYRRAFDREWIRSNMPQAELRREREAWRRGVALTTGLGCIVAAAFAILLSLLFAQVHRKQAAWAYAELSLARMIRMAAQRGVLAKFSYPASVGGLEIGPRLRSLIAVSNAVPHYTDHLEMASETAAILTVPDLKRIGPPHLHTESLSPALLHPEAGQVGSSPDATGGRPAPTNIVVRQWRSPDAQFLASLATNAAGPTLKIVHEPTKAVLFTIDEAIPEPALAFRPDSSQVAIIRHSRAIELYDLSTTNARLATPLRAPGTRQPSRIKYQPGGPWLAEAADRSTEIRLWHTITRERQSIFDPAEAVDFAWHPSGRALAVATDRQAIYIELVLGTNAALPTGPGHRMELKTEMARPAGLTFNHRGDMLACLDGDRRLLVWMPWSGVHLPFLLHGQSFESLQFSPDDKRLDAFCSRTSRCQSWEVLGDEYHALPSLCDPSQGELQYLDLDSRGNQLLAGGTSGLALFDLRSVAWSKHFDTPKTSAAFFMTATNTLLVASRESGLRQIRHGDPAPRDPLQPHRRPPVPYLDLFLGQISAAAPLPGNRAILALPMQFAIVNCTTRETTAEIQTPVPYDRLVTTKDGRWLAARPAGSTHLDIWSLISKLPDPRRRLSLEFAGTHFAFTPDDQWLVFNTGGRLSALPLAEDIQENRPYPLTNTFESTGPFALGGPGGLVAVAESGSRATLYRFDTTPAPTLTKVVTLEIPASAPIVGLIFNPNANQLIALDRDQAIHVWQLDRIEAQFKSLGLRITPLASATQRATAP